MAFFSDTDAAASEAADSEVPALVFTTLLLWF